MTNKIIGFVILLLIIAGAFYYQKTGGGAPAIKYHLVGEIGGEKKGFLDDEEIQMLLAKKHGIKLDYTKAGSIEMVSGAIKPELDFLWPSSQVAQEIFKTTHPNKQIKGEIIFNSPIVLYSWDIVTEALSKKKIVDKQGKTYFITNFPNLIDLIIQRKKWQDIGLQNLYGRLSIISTDPTKSNSGNMFAGLLANMLQNDVVDEKTINQHLPAIQQFFNNLGYLEHSTGDLFDQYLRMGVGSKPIIVGYENQIIEFSLKHKDLWPKVKDKIRILYPVPTVWSSHPLIILNAKAKPLVAALQDPEIMKLAWEKHGFRTGLIGVENDPEVLDVTGIPENITKVMPMPSAKVMNKVIKSVSGTN